MLWDVAKKLCAKLCELTRKDEIYWKQNLDIQYAEYEGNKIFAWWPQDGKPSLTFNDAEIEEYSLGIETLLAEIRKQYERQNRNGYGPTAKKREEEFQKSWQKDEQEKAKDFADAANKFLEAENKKNKR